MRVRIFTTLCVAGALLVGCSGESKKETPYTATEANSSTLVAPTAKVEAPIGEIGDSLFSTKCATCHGSDAKGRADFPRLAGQSKEDLIKKLNGYKDGSYGNKMKSVMEPNAKALSSTQIEMVAEYLSKLK
jgi:cytochrome c